LSATAGAARHRFLAASILICLARRTNGSAIHLPSDHSRPQRRHVDPHPYHGVKNDSMRVRFVQSGQLVASIVFAVDCGA